MRSAKEAMVKLVVALGGNALMRRGEAQTLEAQKRNLSAAAQALAPVLNAHRTVLTHGNGPQIGLLALQSAATGAAMPLDILGAETVGMIGYLLEQELASHLPGSCSGPHKICVLLTQILVDPHDPAFAKPSKPIGPLYDKAAAERLTAERGWAVAPDGKAWRRVVASPAPKRILEIETIRLLIDAGVVVICTGGGGIPVVQGPDGALHGVEAVIDKDASSALLAMETGADALIMLTDVGAAMVDFGTPQERAIRTATPSGLKDIEFAAGSMGPKIEAAITMARAGRKAAIGSLADAARIVHGEAGTWIVPDGSAETISFW